MNIENLMMDAANHLPSIRLIKPDLEIVRKMADGASALWIVGPKQTWLVTEGGNWNEIIADAYYKGAKRFYALVKGWGLFPIEADENGSQLEYVCLYCKCL